MVRLLLDRTLLWILDKIAEAFPILALIYGSSERLALIIDPRYWNFSTELSS